jgi:hypothetical protein
MPEADQQPTVETPTASPFVDQLRIPQFGILTLMLWTAATAALLSLNLTLAGDSIRHGPTAALWVQRVSQTIDAILLAAALVGSGVLIRARCYTMLHRLQPGHWLVLIVSFEFVLHIAARLLYPVLQLNGIGSVPVIQGVAVVTTGLIAAVYVLAFLKLRDAKRWKILMGAKAIAAIMTTLVLLVMLVLWLVSPSPYPLATSLTWIFLFPSICSLAAFLMLPVVAGLDLFRHAVRDWLHWLGVAVVLVAGISSFALQLCYFLLARTGLL